MTEFEPEFRAKSARNLKAGDPGAERKHGALARLDQHLLATKAVLLKAFPAIEMTHAIEIESDTQNLPFRINLNFKAAVGRVGDTDNDLIQDTQATLTATMLALLWAIRLDLNSERFAYSTQVRGGKIEAECFADAHVHGTAMTHS